MCHVQVHSPATTTWYLLYLRSDNIIYYLCSPLDCKFHNDKSYAWIVQHWCTSPSQRTQLLFRTLGLNETQFNQALKGFTQKWPEITLINCMTFGQKLYLCCLYTIKKKSLIRAQHISKGCSESQTIQCEWRSSRYSNMLSRGEV